MTKLVLDNLDTTILDELKRRADQHGWSVEEEARHILVSATGDAVPDRGQGPKARTFLERADSIRERYGSRVTSDAIALLREDRDR